MTIYDNLWQNLTLSDKIRKYLTIYQYLKTFDKIGHSSTKSKDNKWYWRISDNIGQYLSILDSFWQYWTIFVIIGHYLLISNNIITYPAILSRSCCFETFWIMSIYTHTYITHTSYRGAFAPKKTWSSVSNSSLVRPWF